MDNKETNSIFFGTDEFSIAVLEELEKADLLPSLIVTAPSKPTGRKQVITPPPVKVWADGKSIPTLQPEKLGEDFASELKEKNPNLFITASYGKIIPQEVLDIPTKGALNVHPSLLPLYRGSSPIENAILDDAKETGVTVMLMDSKMDHGPILNQEVVFFENWPSKLAVQDELAHLGGQILSETIPLWLNGEIEEQEQDHDLATFTKLIKKEDGEIKLDIPVSPKSSKKIASQDRKKYLKYLAYKPWPGVFYFIYPEPGRREGEKKTRVKITEAEFKDNQFIIKRIIPEGKKEMDFNS